MINTLDPFETFVLRTPLFPYKYAEALTQYEEINDEQIIVLCSDPVVQEAIYIASPSLYYEMRKWIEGKIKNDKRSLKKIKKLKASLVKYLLRMSSRCTPFGIFAGVTTGSVSTSIDVVLSSQKKYIRQTRLDMNYLCALANDLSKIGVIKDKLRYSVNSSLYRIGNLVRYIEYQYIRSRRMHTIVEIENSPYLSKIINRRKKAYINELAELLVDDDISLEDARGFLKELIDNQVLVSELEPSVTGKGFLVQMIQILETLNDDARVNNIYQILRKVNSTFVNIEKNKTFSPVASYEKVSQDLKLLNTKYDLKHLFQTDMYIFREGYKKGKATSGPANPSSSFARYLTSPIQPLPSGLFY